MTAADVRSTEGNADPAIVAVLESPVTAEPVVGRDRPVSLWRRRLVRVASVLAAVGFWQLLTANHVRLWLRFDTLPTVTEIVSAFVNRVGTQDYWLDLGQSLIRILSGFALAAAVGVVTGIMLGRSCGVLRRVRSADRIGQTHPGDRDGSGGDPAVPDR